MIYPLREVVRTLHSDGEGWALWVPTLSKDGARLSLPPPPGSTLHWRVGGRTRPEFLRAKYWTPDFRRKFKGLLINRLGLRPTVAEIFSSRPKGAIRRIEEEIKGIVDALLLCDEKLFTEGSFTRTLIIKTLRKVINIGVTDIDEVTRQYKAFCASFVAFSSRALVGQTPLLEEKNIFRVFSSFPIIRSMIDGGVKDHGLAERASAFLSGRQMVSAGRNVQMRALRTFMRTTGERYNLPVGSTEKAREAGILIGRKVRSLAKLENRDFKSHISLACAGSFGCPTSEGGRATEIRENISRILSHVPQEHEVVRTPFGKVECEPGLARWRCWCRPSPLEALNEDFGKEKPETTLGERDRFWGYDEVIGTQILFCAYLQGRDEGYLEGEEVKLPIPARSLVVPEPGGKARVVTTTTWWNIILQQPLGHSMRELLAEHPSARSGLEKADQAWDFLRLAEGPRNFFEEDFQVLSSDLKEATDAIPPEVAKQLLLGFTEGCSVSGPPVTLAINLVCSQRVVYIKDLEEVFLKVRGVLMGEPLTKAVLTLLGLACEELAIRDYLELSVSEPVRVPWRCFAVVGDDHVAVGPLWYLVRITEYHLLFGSMISKEKHRISSHYVTMTEKVLLVGKLKGRTWRARDLRGPHSQTLYERSPFVDSVKVRLLAPLSKSVEVKNDRNIAIGKAISLGKTLRWLSPHVYPEGFVKAIRQRFFDRMGNYLPKEGTALHAQILLPQEFGGLGLHLYGDESFIIMKVPLPTRQVLSAQLGKPFWAEERRKRILKGFTSNATFRGYDLKDLAWDFILTETFKVRYKMTQLSYKAAEFGEELTELPTKYQLKFLRDKGWYTAEGVLDAVLRGHLFAKLLRGEVRQKSYNTTSWRRRYQMIWDHLYDANMPEAECVITPLQLERLLREQGSNPPLYYVHEWFGVHYTTPEGEEVKMGCTLLEELQQSLPNLTVSGEASGYYRAEGRAEFPVVPQGLRFTEFPLEFCEPSYFAGSESDEEDTS